MRTQNQLTKEITVDIAAKKDLKRTPLKTFLSTHGLTLTLLFLTIIVAYITLTNLPNLEVIP